MKIMPNYKSSIDPNPTRRAICKALESLPNDIVTHPEFFEQLCHALHIRGFSVEPNWQKLLDASKLAVSGEAEINIFPTLAIQLKPY